MKTTYPVHFVPQIFETGFCFYRQDKGTLPWTKGYSVDKRAILQTKGLSHGQKKRPQDIDKIDYMQYYVGSTKQKEHRRNIGGNA